ncbi:50S ribosomal protein L9 [Sphingomicrobium astaxanthinifaciens]|uniref:50S ribosomal protein L9 n=1 Tax=Sphingomicrobium astaxanthinifaciens TaxID=1227949 RepID=UPI001FCB4E4A|nr:50S ribosomal protein L9 [Sphingomicrobium astaxanthinifaciens]MCJ7421927.1 50S ribosomal protein L9 [Sphingomicrobium astaxanthinifaciens]
MDVILLERVEKLGGIGDVVTVKNGYARNYLLPNKKALRANAANKAVFEANREKIEKENAEKRGVAETEAKKMDGTTLVLIRQASNTGQLYGSVATRDIVAGMEEEGHKIEKSQVQLLRPIKTIGMHDVTVVLHPEVSVTVKANVARSPEEAELQAQGVDIIQQMYEDEQAELAGNALQPDSEDDIALEPGEVVAEDGSIEPAEGEAADAAAPAAAEEATADEDKSEEE